MVRQGLLCQYYARVLSLREYLLCNLPITSKFRRKKIISAGRGQSQQDADRGLADLLDKTLVGIRKYDDISQKERAQQWTTFSQRADTSASTLANMSGGGIFFQAEV